MSNKDNLWRLQDEEGKPAAERPRQDVLFKMKMANGEWQEVQRVQSIRGCDWTFAESLYSIPAEPVAIIRNEDIRNEAIDAARIRDYYVNTEVNNVDLTGINTEQMTRYLHEQVRVMTHDFVGRAPEIRTETIEQTIPDIGSRMAREVHRYQERFADRPQYISLDRGAYRSLWAAVRNNRYTTIAEGDRFMGLPIICNPGQVHPIMALGSPLQEGIEGRLYNE